MYRDLIGLMKGTMVKIANPRVALILDDNGEVHFATTLPPGEAAQVLSHMADRVRRYGGNFVRDHYDRGQASQWN